MSHLVLLVAYDGTSYYGWQKTSKGPSIEGTLEDALQQILQEPIRLQAASRTDRGVHAVWQVVDFTISKPYPDLYRLKVSLNQLMAPDIRCLDVAEAPYETFHPTLDVIRKRYRYYISTGIVQPPHLRFTHWHIRRPLDRDLLRESAKLFIGTHDFRGMCNRRADLNEEDTVRSVFSVDVHEKGNSDLLAISIEADNFLYKMARNIVGTMAWTALGKTPLTHITTALTSRERSCAGVTAPAHGLFLERVFYHRSPFVSSYAPPS